MYFGASASTNYPGFKNLILWLHKEGRTDITPICFRFFPAYLEGQKQRLAIKKNKMYYRLKFAYLKCPLYWDFATYDAYSRCRCCQIHCYVSLLLSLLCSSTYSYLLFRHDWKYLLFALKFPPIGYDCCLFKLEVAF